MRFRATDGYSSSSRRTLCWPHITTPRIAFTIAAGAISLCSEDRTFPVVAAYWQFFQHNREISFILVVCCAALVGSISVASAQTTGPGWTGGHEGQRPDERECQEEAQDEEKHGEIR
jgi:hypothetical protein